MSVTRKVFRRETECLSLCLQGSNPACGSVSVFCECRARETAAVCLQQISGGIPQGYSKSMEESGGGCGVMSPSEGCDRRMFHVVNLLDTNRIFIAPAVRILIHFTYHSGSANHFSLLY